MLLLRLFDAFRADGFTPAKESMIVTILFKESSSLLAYEDFVVLDLVFPILFLPFTAVSWISDHGVTLELRFWLSMFRSIQIVSRSHSQTIFPVRISLYDP